MARYFSSLEAVQQATCLLEGEACPHCGRVQCLISHGFIYKKTDTGWLCVGKRVFCSNRRQRRGCGRTCPWYVASVLRFMHYCGSVLFAFVAALAKGMAVEAAFVRATGAFDARQAWRWMDKLEANLSSLRSALRCAPLSCGSTLPRRRQWIVQTFEALYAVFGPPLLATFQLTWQRVLLRPVSQFSTG